MIGDFTPEKQEGIVQKITEENTIVSLPDLMPEDVLVFKIEEELHVGLYLGYGRMLHAKKDGKSRISRLTTSWDKYFLFGIRERDGKDLHPPAGPPAIVAVALVIADYAAASFIAGGLIALSLTTIGCFDRHGHDRLFDRAGYSGASDFKERRIFFFAPVSVRRIADDFQQSVSGACFIWSGAAGRKHCLSEPGRRWGADRYAHCPLRG